MKEFQTIDVLCHLYQRNIKRECVIDNLAEGICLYILAKETVGYLIGNLLKREILDRTEKRLWKGVDTLGHI